MIVTSNPKEQRMAEESKFVQLTPLDRHNLKLESNVHPSDWINPTPKSPTRPYHLVVIGAGTAGLVTAAGAAGLGARVALIERELMGGDCLNVGCVPSKSLISSARVAATVQSAGAFGIHVPDSTNASNTFNGDSTNFDTVMERMRRLRADISPVDSAKRFSELGVDVFFGQGQFCDDQTIRVTRADGSSTELKYKKSVIATGARAAAPSISGLDSVEYLTNETLFSLTELPPRFGIIGAGPIGVEMAQAFARFGSEVFLFQRGAQILPREDAAAAALLQQQLIRDGIKLVLGSTDQKIGPAGEGAIRLAGTRTENEQPYDIVVDQLLVAVGRAPNTDGLNLESVNVNYDGGGVEVNDRMQTTNKRIFAAGDICSKYKFTHAADFQARIVIQNALFAVGPLGKKKASDLIIPWATYTSPEIAHVGMYPQDAKQAGIEIDTYVQNLEHIDRAILEGHTEGFVKVHTRKGTDEIVGATIVAENAGDLISELTLAMTNRIGLSKIGATIHPYPTVADAIRKLGDQFNKTRLTTWSQRLLRILMRLNVGK
jgi:pyruvate/2-oxoglutarate dehydrogenase complex dihydrolipoamide dehydrogenase (E3) component